MKRCLPLLLLLACPNPVLAQLQMHDVKVRHSKYGPERKSLQVLPGDEVFFTFKVTGVRTTADGKVDMELTQQVLDANGKVAVDIKSPLNEVLALGGSMVPGYSSVSLGLKTPPGDYTVKVGMTDRLAKTTVSFERKLTCLKPALGIVRPSLSYEPEGKSDAGTTFVLGQRVHYHLTVVGYDRGNKIDLAFAMQVRDDNGKDMMPTPVKAEAKSEDEKAIAQQESVTFNGFLTCNRAGSFTAIFTVTDRVTNKSTNWEMPLKVLE